MSSLVVAASLSIPAVQTADGTAVNFRSKVGSTSTVLLEPSNINPAFIVGEDGILTCVQPGTYNITASVMGSQNGFDYPYTSTLFIKAGPNMVWQEEKNHVIQLMNMLGSCQAKLVAGDKVKVTYLLTGTLPVIVPMGTSLLITRVN
ncbi:MAG TPA: hypothetical protein PKD85_02490 [Saprospiraceae bacterium]|nr:hypothetical protein [Saprospiraceae bacterium]